MYITGLSAIEHQKGTLGVSQDEYAIYHRRAGFALMVLFLLQCIFGFVRPLHKGIRRIFIVFHWLGGLIIRYGGSKPFSFNKLHYPLYIIFICILKFLKLNLIYSFKSCSSHPNIQNTCVTHRFSKSLGR